MHNQYIKDTLGNIYIGLNNHDRKYCYNPLDEHLEEILGSNYVRRKK